MRIAFFGTPDFAVPSLDLLVARGESVVAVVTQPDRPLGRSHSTLIPSPVKRRALDAGLEVLQPDRPAGDAFVATLTAARADLGVVVAYGHILKPVVLGIPRLLLGRELRQNQYEGGIKNHHRYIEQRKMHGAHAQRYRYQSS